jgi:phosphotransferase system enzyme I (PtsI)
LPLPANVQRRNDRTRRVQVDVRLKGVPLSPGIALGRACFYRRETSGPDSIGHHDHRYEALRLRQALRRLDHQLESLALDAAGMLGRESAEIFRARRLMLADETFRHRLLRAVEAKGYTAAKAVARELDFYRVQLGTADSVYLRQRASDIREIQLALLDCLNRVAPYRSCKDVSRCGVTQCTLANDHILVGGELSASLPVETDRHTVGFVVEKGGPNSHAVILARARRRPVVGNISSLPAAIPRDACILINGGTGEVILNPSAKTRARHQSAPQAAAATHSVAPVPGLKVMANIERFADVHEALAARADGIGLYRTEIELLGVDRLPGEAEQSMRYSEVVRVMTGRTVCIRLLDFGADKPAPCLDFPGKTDAAAGLRGARLLLAYPDLLRDQARALARASRHGPIHVLYPMIVDVDQFHALRTLFARFVADLQPCRLLHGVLFEVPSACLQARLLLEAADFGCIGSNDLIQYLFAVDRASGAVPDNPSFDEAPVLWRLIEDLSAAGRQTGKPMALCGELAGNPDLTHRIIQAGITNLSTSPSRIATVRLAKSRMAAVQAPDAPSL